MQVRRDLEKFSMLVKVMMLLFLQIVKEPCLRK